MVAASEFMEKNPNTVRAFVRALNRSVKAMIDNPMEALASLRTRDATLDLDVEAVRLDLMIKQLILTQNVVKNGLSSADPNRLAASIDNVRHIINTKVPVTADQVYTDRFLPPASERVPPVYRR
jgi:NitT/TauT family transport system substrate-binding protein